MTDIWKHSKYLDMWSSVHFLSGFLLSGVFYWLGSSFVSAFVFSLIIMAVWEAFEWATKIIEPSPNVAVDIAVGIAGFLVAGYLYYLQEAEFDLSLYLAVLGITLILALWGFVDFLKKGYR